MLLVLRNAFILIFSCNGTADSGNLFGGFAKDGKLLLMWVLQNACNCINVL